MTETVIPTMSLRYVNKPQLTSGFTNVFEMKPVLQQRFDKPSGGHEWRDVPTVEDETQ